MRVSRVFVVGSLYSFCKAIYYYFCLLPSSRPIELFNFINSSNIAATASNMAKTIGFFILSLREKNYKREI